MIRGKNIKWKDFINYAVIAVVTIIFGSLSVTGNLASSTQFLLEKMSIAILMAISLSLVVGFLGELSLGHAGFMCVGAYLGGKVAAVLAQSMGNSIVTLILSVLVGGAVAAVCGVVIGLPALRLKGDYLAIVTLAFGEIVKSIFQNTSFESFGGTLGLSTPRYDKKVLFIIGFVLVIICLAVIQNLIRSKHGRAITAIRDNEIAAKAMGINVTKYKLLAFTVSACFAGIGGVLYSWSNYTVQSSNFGYNYSIEILVMVVLGGMGNINGGILAATLITYLNTTLATVLTGDLAVLQNLVYALILIVIVIYNNSPALKSFRERYNLKALLHKIKLVKHDPMRVKDDEAVWDRVPTKIAMDEILSVDTKVRTSVAEKGDPYESEGED
ncbi:MAG: branched-chain amino acid ABC transporter permease [Clostridia bacterium]|nr:branched-chain amino acid ABC transporter permease [Clostridia bacterium]